MTAITFFGGEVEEVLEDTETMKSIMAQYPVGSGTYGQLRIMDQNMTNIAKGLSPDARKSVEGAAFFSTLKKLQNLHLSEANIKSSQKIKSGQTTQAKEDIKKEKYDIQREKMGLTPLQPEAGFNFMPLILIAGAGVGAYLMFKGK